MHVGMFSKRSAVANEVIPMTENAIKAYPALRIVGFDCFRRGKQPIRALELQGQSNCSTVGIEIMVSKIVQRSVLAVAFTCVLGMSSSAFGCPNCKLANETDSALPRAYMYSILFMIGMPATIFTGFGISLYRLTKKAELEAANAAAGELGGTSTEQE